MKIWKISIFLLSLLFIACNKPKVETGAWTVEYNDANKSLSISKNGLLLCNDLYASYKLDEKLITTRDYQSSKVRSDKLNDKFGEGVVMKITYTSESLPTLVQAVYLYNNCDYLLTDFTIESRNSDIATNYMAPINVDKLPSLLGEGDNRALFIPFDNDAWIRFQSQPIDFEKLTSYEVSAAFNKDSRKGLVVGSVEHDVWKSAVVFGKGESNELGTINCYGGVADSLTRDVLPHGLVKGKFVKSPKVLLGVFDDWRRGMETYADANVVVSPPKEWNKAMPFGWNSWGVLQFSLTYQKAIEVSDFFKTNLQNNNFINRDNTLYIGLDSGWNSFTEEQLKDFVNHCKANGQIAGVYWTPFTDWGKNPEREVDNATQYKYKDVYVYAKGQPQILDGAYAIDPTHPAIEERMKKVSELFRRCGFEYVKMDFMTHGALEGDKWYNPHIQTGIQAYNYGMQLLNKYFGDMYINLSISPIFPSQYAQSRRIACDAWNKIKDTEYTMNAVSYGWWIDRVYRYNDADHIVLQQATDGENRARITSAVITGLYIAGDDFSKGGSTEGKEKAKQFLTNADVNAAALGRSFYPVEGNGAKSEDQFMYVADDGTIYYAIFNYNEDKRDIDIPSKRIGLDLSSVYQVKDLWSHESVDTKQKLEIQPKDVRFLKISKK